MRSAPPSSTAVFVRGARQLVTLRGPVPRRGLFCSQLHVIRDGSLLIVDGRIVEAGSTRRIENLRMARKARVIDVTGKVVTPGLIDSSLQVAAGPASLEAFEQRIAGLAQRGTRDEDVGATPRGRSSESLERLRRWLRLACAGGTTMVELSSGVGRPALKELRALRALGQLHGEPVEIVVGFDVDVSARAGSSPAAVEEVLEKAARRPRIASALRLDGGEGGFDAEVTRRLAEAARGYGYRVKMRTGGSAASGGIRMAVDLEAACAEGLAQAAEAEIDLLAASTTVATLLPNVAYDRGAGQFPPARRMLDRGAAVSLASGFRSDTSPGFGLQMAMALACREMKLMPEEALTCCTINAAAAVGRAATLGSLEPNKQADIAVFDVSDYREIPYYFGANLCTLTIKRGRIAYRAAGQPAPPGGG